MKLIDLKNERAERSNLAKDMTVRMAVERVLRLIDDEPESIEAAATHCIIIVGTVDDDGGTKIRFHVAGTRSAWETMGMLAEATEAVADF